MRNAAAPFTRATGVEVARGRVAKTAWLIFGGRYTFPERDTIGQNGEGRMIPTQNNRGIPLGEQRRLSAEAGCIAPDWLCSFLYWCSDLADGKHTVSCLQRSNPEKFQQRQRVQRAKPKPKPPEPELLSWSTVNALVREAAPVDRPMLASFVRWHTSERAALRTIETLRKTFPAIWQVRVTPRN